MNRNHISLLIVDDDDEFRSTVVARFSRVGFRVAGAASGEDALRLLEQQSFDVMVCDMRMPGISGLQLVEQLREAGNESEVIFLTGQGTIETAVQAMKLGAYDFLSKPFPLKELETLVERAYEKYSLRKENRQLKALLERQQPQSQIVGQSQALSEVFRLIQRAGPSDRAILIQGESGTGKELVARDLHRYSNRAAKPLVTINCAALPETLLESELFGFEKGAFTGANSAKPGLFEVADGGTLFIDEIGEMPAALQAKLLRILEDGSFRRLGSIKERHVNVRILAATNRDLAKEVEAGRFREDLYYRINVMTIELPPLRERHGDIPILVNHFLGSGWNVDPEALRMMEGYHWPGNVRQLINVLERGKILADQNRIRLIDLPKEIVSTSPRVMPAIVEVDRDDLASIERAKVVEILQREHGNKTHAAKRLGIDRRKLYRLIERYAITPQEVTGAVEVGGGGPARTPTSASASPEE